MADECRAAIAALERAHAAPPFQFTRESDAALRSAVAVRDELIAQLEPGDATAHAALDQVNIALSIIVGLTYPAAGLPRETIQHARSALQTALGLLQ